MMKSNMKYGRLLIILTAEILILFAHNIDGYSKVIKNGGSSEVNDSDNSTAAINVPRIHRAREGVDNVNLWFPSV